MKKASIIECEGTDGAGKSTALKYLVKKLQDSGLKVLETREVGCPHIPTAVKLRELVLDPNSGLNGMGMEFIFAAMRTLNQDYYKTISKDYDVIISDRGWFSHLAYTDHNVSPEFTEEFYIDVVAKYTDRPDMVIYLPVDTDTALKRRIKRGTGTDVIEMKGVEFQEKVRESFNKYLDRDDNASLTIDVDANQSIEDVEKALDDVADFIYMDATGLNMVETEDGL